MNTRVRYYIIIFIITCGLQLGFYTTGYGQNRIDLTLDTAVDIAMKRSYQIRMLQMSVRGSNLRLKAEQAALKTQVYMNLTTPDFENISDYKWNSNLGRDEIVRQNTQLWQSELSIKQPLMLGRYPTNGFLSLNYRLYQYRQYGGERVRTDLYNRLYLRFEQPFFLPNTMKNDLETAELDLKDNELSFIADQMEIMEDVAQDYYELFELRYRQDIFREQISMLEDIFHIADAARSADSSYVMDYNQIRLEMNSVREELLSNESRFRAENSNMKQKLRLGYRDTLIIEPEIVLRPLDVNLEQAIAYGLEHNPELQRLDIHKQLSEIDLDNEKGENSFHMTLAMTYGLEKKDDYFDRLWRQFDNSNTVTLNAYIPLWDGGNRRHRIQAEELDVLRRELEMTEEAEDIRKDIRNNFTNMNEYYQRAVNMHESIALARDIVASRKIQYTDGNLSLNDLIQSIQRLRNTEEQFIEIYLNYKNSLLELMVDTYYDFENNISLIEAFEQKFKDN